MFRALLCLSSVDQNCIIQHLVSSHFVGSRPVHRLREELLRLLRFKLLTPNVNYSGRTAPLTSKVAFYIFIQQIQAVNILNVVYTLFLSLQNAVCFIILIPASTRFLDYRSSPAVSRSSSLPVSLRAYHSI